MVSLYFQCVVLCSPWCCVGKGLATEPYEAGLLPGLSSTLGILEWAGGGCPPVRFLCLPYVAQSHSAVCGSMGTQAQAI